MCGIFCLISNTEDVDLTSWSSCFQLLRHRGPDCTSQLTKLIGPRSCYFSSSVLWTQGPSPFPQPVTDSSNVLVWNGDLYSTKSPTESDTKVLFEALVSRGIDALTEMNGPYAFVFYEANSQRLYFGRDLLGRQSLLFKFEKNGLVLSSVGDKSDGFEEVPSCGFFSVSLSSQCLDLQLNRWAHLENFFDLFDYPEAMKIKETRVLTHQLFSSSSYDWQGSRPSSDRFSSYIGMDDSKVFSEALKDPEWSFLVNDLKKHLCESVKKRVESRPSFCKNCIKTRDVCCHPKVALCFSGGLDSTLLAFIAHTYIPPNEPIDLFNVAFERARSSEKSYNVPDRGTGLSSLEILKRIAPDRQWNFVKINVPMEELNEWRHERICHLISPLNSVLDDSLGSALWFASRGYGLLDQEQYTSPARILLLGMGADEMFGGYSRHRKLFLAEGYNSLGCQLMKELRHIGRRNLGRDNRVVADHGLQPRLPFLDEQLVAFVDRLPPWDKCYLGKGLSQGVGDKFLLRLLAWELGLETVAYLPKRAMQFGSRIADPKQKGHEASLNLL